MLMSYMMSFSAGVCLAVSFVFQIDGFKFFILQGPSNDGASITNGCTRAGLTLAMTFLGFFVFEQCATIIQTWHSRSCGGIPPCAIEVASQPLEAASVVRTIAEHTNLSLNEMKCSTLTQETIRAFDHSSESQADGCRTFESYSVPLLTEEVRPITPPRGQRPCPLCDRKSISSQGSHIPEYRGSTLVMGFLLALFTIHSFAEGLGLGVSACPTKDPRTRGATTATVAIAILLHKTLSAFAVGAALLRENVSWGVMALISIFFSMMSPLGSLTGYMTCASSDEGFKSLNALFVLIAAGTFLFISLVEFLPNSFDEGSKGPGSIRNRVLKTILFLGGSFAVMVAEMNAGE
eukprot:Blabericola_migrator_1__7439@NODE_3791_length_1508_cov_173_284525_g805_i2_p1_GENE_NODE_3791_length_1508_cov_173_284525_g805_i2NODE_3791_length_1508_cov_173_284525_g805_i2_p1_ORF_typecomplete_len349_score45_23Zip/PF02535_22/1_2e32_NODE_3791_length_1508_cov_173_284525_g805_i23551401